MCWKRGQTPQHHPRHLHFRERKVRDRGVSVHRPVEWALHRGAKRSLPGGTSRIYHFTLFAPCCVSTFLLFFAVFAVFHFSPRGAFLRFYCFSLFLLFSFFRAVVCFYNFTFFRFYIFPPRGGGTSDPAVFHLLTVLHFLPHEVGCLVFTF